MRLTAENLVEQYNIFCEDQNGFTHCSQTLANDTVISDRSENEMIPYEVKEWKKAITFDTDEHPFLTIWKNFTNYLPLLRKMVL